MRYYANLRLLIYSITSLKKYIQQRTIKICRLNTNITCLKNIKIAFINIGKISQFTKCFDTSKIFK